MALTNRRVTLREYVTGELTPDVFEVVELPVRDLGPGEALIGNIYATVDPSQSRRMRKYDNYAPPFEIGGVIQGYTVGQVLKSRTPELEEGGFYAHFQGGWESHSIIRPLPPGGSPSRLQRADPGLGPLTLYIGALGGKGFAAYVGVKVVGKAMGGEIALISAAAGAVGSIAGQLTRHYGARTVGIAGGPRKVAFVRDELGFDDAIDHRAEDFEAQLDRACPDGVDVYLENVGGKVGRAVLEQMRVHGRYSICGLVAEYEFDEPPPAPNLFVTVRRGFLIHGWLSNMFIEHFPAFREEVGDLVASGAVKIPEDIVEGLENAPRAMLGMLHGDNFGQRFLQIAPDPLRPS
jgi:NADPH-dependent curcumin reductase